MKNFFRVLSVVVSVIVIGLSVYGITHTRQILDYVALYNYSPPPEIASIADETTMNDYTRRVFYVNHPDLQDKASFKNSCIQQEETIVLGCYIENNGIYLLEVDDPRLDGIIEVTSAHEVLHAMYDRLSEDERREIDAMTATFFETLDNDRIKTNIENYQKRDPGVVPNELHSILGTEVRNLSPELEAYYARYFDDRLKIVALSEKYENTFVELERRVESYRVQLDDLRGKLDTNEKELDATGKTIDQERKRLDALLAANRTEEYNSGVSAFNASVNEYNRLVQSRKAMINEYNKIVGLYNEVASTEAELVESLKTDQIETRESR